MGFQENYSMYLEQKNMDGLQKTSLDEGFKKTYPEFKKNFIK